jgi:putative membrane protein
MTATWSLEPVVVAALLLTAWWYWSGIRALRRSAGPGRGVRDWEIAAFAGGWFLLAVALLSPLHHLSTELFSAHMVQHELLMVAAAPLLVLGRPLLPALWAFPIGWRRRLGAWSASAPVETAWTALTRPSVAWSVHAAAIWLWHVPVLFQATLRSELVHNLQHLSFLGSALLFWWALFQGRAGRLGAPTAVVYLFTTAVHTSLLGALLTFSSRIWYPVYRSTSAPWGLSPLEDQQLAGLIMWVPAGLGYLAAALAIAASWLRDPGDRSLRLRKLGLTLLPMLIVLPALAGCRRSLAVTDREAAQLTGGNPHRGALAIRQYGCASCHTVPGVPGARGTVGPALGGISGRPYIAGVITNSPDNLIRWIQHPQQIDPLTAMPDVGVNQAVARDIASYLYTLK